MNAPDGKTSIDALLGVASNDRRIGKILLESGKITNHDALNILLAQRELGLRFGDAALRLGILTASEISEALALQFECAHLARGAGGFSDELVSTYQPKSKTAEFLRSIRTQLLLRWFTPEQRTLAVVGAGVADGRSYLTANLAALFAQLGEKTLLIDAALHTPRQHKIFNTPNRMGLTSVLAELEDCETATQHLPVLRNLSVLPSGPIPPNPAELLSRPRFGELLAGVSTQYDVVLIDTSAAMEHAEVQNVAVRAHGALVVARRNHTKVAELQRLVASLTDNGVEVVGSVLNEG